MGRHVDRILFLDFDGVLHPENARAEARFSRLPLLESWLRARQQVGVVVSSSWRGYRTVESLSMHFAADVRHQVVGLTPIYHRILPEPPAEWLVSKREFEVRHWIETSEDPGRPWVCLDDMASLFTPGLDRLVLCSPSIGLTSGHLELLDRKLGIQTPSRAPKT